MKTVSDVKLSKVVRRILRWGTPIAPRVTSRVTSGNSAVINRDSLVDSTAHFFEVWVQDTDTCENWHYAKIPEELFVEMEGEVRATVSVSGFDREAIVICATKDDVEYMFTCSKPFNQMIVRAY